MCPTWEGCGKAQQKKDLLAPNKLSIQTGRRTPVGFPATPTLESIVVKGMKAPVMHCSLYRLINGGNVKLTAAWSGQVRNMSRFCLAVGFK